MTPADFHFLLSPAGRQLLASLANEEVTPEYHLQLATRLRERTAHAAAVVETLLLRQQAAGRFQRAAAMYFTRTGLAQATSEVVATYRARRFASAGARHVADLGCGIGGDALALAAVAEVTGVEWDPVRIAMAQENVRVYGHGARFHPLQADLLQLTPLPVDALFFDPARRDERGRRYHSVADYRPPLSWIHRWRTWVPAAAVKISPGVAYHELPNDADIEFISVAGEVKDGVLWFGPLRDGSGRRATLLPAGESVTTADLPARPVPVTPPAGLLYEPDRAVIRAHLVEAVAARLNATKIDADIAYLTSDRYVESPFARAYTVLDVFPFQLKRLRHYLRQRQVGEVTIKKRGSPLEPAWLRQQLRLHGPAHRILFLTFVAGQSSVIVGKEAPARNGATSDGPVFSDDIPAGPGAGNG